MRSRRDLGWHIVFWTLDVPLALAGILLELIAAGARWASDALDVGRQRWLRRVRVWSGRTPDGLTVEQVAEREARRAATLAEMRQPSSWKPL